MYEKEEAPSIEFYTTNLEDCQQAAYTEVDQIEKNLIGEWQLIGFGCGECVPSSVRPEATLVFTENKGTLDLKYGEEDTLLEFSWSIELFNAGTEDIGFRLKTEPAHFALDMDVYCENYMYFNDTIIDGLFLFYEKQ